MTQTEQRPDDAHYVYEAVVLKSDGGERVLGRFEFTRPEYGDDQDGHALEVALGSLQRRGGFYRWGKVAVKDADFSALEVRLVQAGKLSAAVPDGELVAPPENTEAP